MMASAAERAFHTTPRNVPYLSLQVANAFQQLTASQQRYAYHIMAAGWCGVPVVAQQLSPEALPILRMYHTVLHASPLQAIKSTATGKAGVAADDVDAFIDYFAMVYANVGNYLSFGDSKFIPACSAESFRSIVGAVVPAETAAKILDDALLDRIYDLREDQLTLDMPPKGISAYYGENVTEADVTVANAYLSSINMSGVNTRVFKEADGLLVIRVASVDVRREPVHVFNGRSVCVEYGDFHDEMSRVVEHLKLALPDVANAQQHSMLEHYIAHFTSGDVEAHKASQRAWVKDLGPDVESNIGFVETYRDPSGVRAEWEGFVAAVNKKQSEVYASLVQNAEQFIAQLPWGAAYERDQFVSPDFTSLDVVGFATSGIPAGINIPNYDDVRQEDGFKNVYLGNVVNAIDYTAKPSHLTKGDWERYKSCITTALSVNVGIHELLGHGTGKLFMEKEDGTKNFDASQVMDLFTHEPVRGWYKPGQTWGSVFGGVSSSYEECRAEVVSLYLCLDRDLLRLFGCDSPEAQDDVVYVAWLNMVRAGLCALEFYTPETRQWRQAHMRARYGILNALSQGPHPVVTIVPSDEEGLVIELDEARIRTHGKAVLADVLKHLQLYKSTADAERGVEYYTQLTSVSDVLVGHRAIVLERRKPRKQFVQPTLQLTADGNVIVKDHEGSVAGMVESFLVRHGDVPL